MHRLLSTVQKMMLLSCLMVSRGPRQAIPVHFHVIFIISIRLQLNDLLKDHSPWLPEWKSEHGQALMKLRRNY